MKRIKQITVIFIFAFMVCYPIAWLAASHGVFGDVEFGYYEEFYLAKHVIEKSGCAEVIEYSGVNADVFFLEEFHFKVTTKSGQIVRLWFDGENMDVSQLCYEPVKLFIGHPSHEEVQTYSVEMLAELAREKNIKLGNLRDLLCNLDELEQIVKEHHGDANDDPYSWDDLRIDFPTEEKLNRWRYTDIKTTGILNFP
jgi:hypothetical protein